MRHIIALSLGVLALALVSCRREDTTPEEARDAMQQPVVFTASLGGYAVKSADASFGEGDAIGIFALEPFNKANLRGTVSGTSVTLETPLKWKPVRQAVFLAYYPYDSAQAGETGTFTVRTDQLSDANYRQSDFRGAATTAVHGKPVSLEFGHLLSKLTVQATCADPAETVTAVTIGKSVIEVKFDISAPSVTLGSNQAEISAGRHGGTGFEAILVPQSLSDLELRVTTSRGRSLVFHPAEPLQFDSGYAYVATVSVPKEDVPVGNTLTFSYTLTEWEDDGGSVSFTESTES